MEEQIQNIHTRFKGVIPIYRDQVCIYPNQIDAFTKIIYSAIYNPYISLVAQMQSGKTDTFLLCAFEYLRFDMVDQVVLFSGNSDLELKKQTLKGIDDFAFKYCNYLQMLEINQMDAQILYLKFKSKIQVVWSSELHKQEKVYNTQNTLFIWEESHYAQSVEMLPCDFLKSINLSPSGKSGKYIEKRNYFISVSATPFSEIANIVLLNQEKKIVYLVPGEEYKGVKYFMDTKMIVEHENSSNDLMQAIKLSETRFPPNKHFYGIIRCFGKNEKEFKKVALSCGLDVQHYNLEKKETINEDIGLHIEPLNNTLVFIKGALRMGKQVCKDHVGFVFETTENPNTDTILQGLLGRMCSFTTISHVRIYLHCNIVQSGELERYLEFIQDISEEKMPTSIPVKGMNVKRGFQTMHKTKNNTYSTCLIYVPCKYITVLPGHPVNACISSIFNDIENYPDIVNKNTEEQNIEIREILINNTTILSVHKLSKSSNKKKVPKILESFHRGTEFHSGTHYDVVNIWFVDTIIPEYKDKLQVNDLYIEVKTKSATTESEFNVTTTQKEVFCYETLK